MLKVAYDWLILPPADLIAYLVLVPIAFGPLVATIATWIYVVGIRDDTSSGKPQRVSTYVIAGIISFYVFIVTGTALTRIPHAYYHMTRDDD